jgi:hypothetical protein
MVSTLPLVILMMIHLLCLQLTMQVMTTTPEEHISTSDADHYQSLIVQRMFSTQMKRVEKN